MVDFNPQVPFSDGPNYTGVASAISAPPANVSKEIAYKTTGEAIGGLAKIADQFIETKAKNEATEGATAIRDITTQTLETATQPQNTVPQPTTQGKVGDPSLLDSNAQMEAPGPVKDGLTRFSTIAAARDASSGRNDTLYTQQLNALAVRMRAQYPGYRPIIDETIKSITGMDPANAYLNSLLADQKASATSKEKIYTDAINDVRGLAGTTTDGVASNAMLDYLMRNKNNPDAISNANKWIYNSKRTASQAAEQTVALTARGQNDDQLKLTANTLFNTQMDGMFNSHFYAHEVASGHDPSKDAEMLDDARRNPGSYTTTQINDATMRMTANKDALVQQMRFQASQFVIDPSTGKPALDSRGNKYSMNSLLGPQAEEIIQRKAEGYNTIIKSVADKDTGLATYTARNGRAVRDDLDNNIISKPENQSLLRTEWMGQHTPQGLQGQVLTEAMTAGVGKTLQNVFNDKTQDMLVNGVKIGQRQTVTSFKKDIEDINNKVNTGTATDAERSKLAEGLVNNIKYLGNQPVGPKGIMMDDATQMRIANHYFGDSIGVLHDFNQGYYKDASGKPVADHIWNAVTPTLTYVPGREAAWDKLTNPLVTANMARLGKLPGGQEVVNKYVNFAEAEHGQMVTEQIKSLNRYQDVAKQLGVHIAWDSSSGGFSVIDKNEQPIQSNANIPPGSNLGILLRGVEPVIGRLNQVGKNMMQIQDSLGNKQGMQSYYLNLLQRQGLAPNENMAGMGAEFYKAIAAAHKSVGNRIQDVFDDAKGSNK
jgi:hypothetical protein